MRLAPHQAKGTLLRCGERAASICVVLDSKKSSTYCREYASGFLEPAALHLPPAHSPRNEGLLGQTPSSRSHKHSDRYMYVTREHAVQLRRIETEMPDQHIGEEVAELDRRADISP